MVRSFAGSGSSRKTLGPWIIGVGLSGVAAACGVIAYRNVNLRSRIKAAASRATATFRQSSSPALAPLREASALGSMDTLVPGSYSIPDTAADIDYHPSDTEEHPTSGATLSDTGSGHDPWIDHVRQAMGRRPIDLGYDKPDWNARLLNRYLLDIHSTAVPATRLRAVLKDLGYRWEQNRYVRDHSWVGA